MLEVIPKRRRLVAPNLHSAEQKYLTASAKVYVMTRPSERRSIFLRFRDKGATPESIATAEKLDRPHILQIIRLESKACETERYNAGFKAGRLSVFAEMLGRGPAPNSPAMRAAA